MTRRYDDQLEIQFGGNEIEDIAASGWWQDQMSRGCFIRALGLGAIAVGAAASGASAEGVVSAARRSIRRVATPGAGQTIAVALNGFNEYDQCAATGVIKALQGTRYKLIMRQENFDTKQELPTIETLIAQKPAGISIQPSTVAGSCRGAQQAKSGGVKVIQNQFWFKKTPCDSIFTSLLQWDNFGGGKLMGQYIKKVVPAGGKILRIVGIPGQGFSEPLTAGLKAELGSKWPIVASEPGNYSRSTAISVTQTMLTAHPDAKVIVSDATEMGAGVASYLQRTGNKNVVNITSDANHELVQYLQNGFIAADRYVSPAQGGFLSIVAIRSALEKGHTPHAMPQPQRMITKSDLTSKSNTYFLGTANLGNVSGYICYDPLLKQAQKATA